ncbi:EAL domain-containing protein [Alishewanella sp. SMS8]|uniref:EAL domain-containing protein n=1 Tax=Alishewanella sp. SMS8 TaxID=2994676 RepID=UPI002741F034|nr:EAL domain-containing protein [Alishewanella sp. SMS8]MDP5035712.1 EAL domain-containing protein [Alishewanella sp.]MDP5187941.1 EAL domain-containing protein [Alishewanella sp.]MDP5460388.1 EAL domain-containing protein [Alishewanella sp. SMS8]
MEKILLVDDEINILKSLERLLRRAGFNVFTAESAEQALQLLALTPCKVVISDYRMPEMNGGTLLKQIHKRYPNTVCMILSGYADFNAVIDLLNAGVVFRFLQKPWDDSQLLTEVESAFKKYKSKRSEHIRTQFLISSPEPLLEIALNGVVLRCNFAAQQLLQLSAAEINGSLLEQVFNDLTADKVMPFLQAKISMLVASKLGKEFELVVQKSDNDIKLIKIQQLDELSSTFTNIVNLPMVLNQSQLIQEMDNLLYCEDTFAVVSLQIRDFNLMADIIGIHEAEGVFERVSVAFLQGMERQGRLAYLANEQFILLFPNVSSESELHQKILEFINLVDARQLIKGKMVQLGFTVAYAIAPEDGRSGKAILNNVLLTNRLNSKGNVDFFMRYSASLTANRKQKLQLSEALYYAVEQEELSLQFQPKWDIKTNKIIGAEVLLRWHSSAFGSVSPAVFIPIAEEDGQILELGHWVLSRSLQFLAKWQKEDIAVLPLAVNMSALQLVKADFLQETLQLIEQYAISTDLLQLEITESAVMENLESNAQKLTELKNAGLSLAIDDFGTGYSSLAYLTRLPVDTLKIDRALITDLDGNLNIQTMLQNIIRMAHDLNQTVVVEGVETAEQLTILERLGCDQVQGFLLSKPLNETDYIALLSANAEAPK